MNILRIADLAARRTDGAAGFMLRSSEELIRRGHEVTHLFAEDLAPAGTPGPLRRFVAPIAAVWQTLRATRRSDPPEVVEIHEPTAGLYALVRRIPRAPLPPLVVLSYGLEERRWAATQQRSRRIGRKLSIKSRLSTPLTILPQARLALRLADRVLVPSTEDARHVVDVLGVASERVLRINTGVDSEFTRISRSYDRPLERILFLGSWIDRKGTPELTRAWAALAGQDSNLRLTVAGVGVSVGRALDDFPPHVRDSVSVVPHVGRRELKTLLADHDVFVLPSWFEGMPLSLLEAAAAGMPCIASGVCGVRDFIRSENSEMDGGILISPHSPDELVSALRGLVADPERARRLGQRGRARVENFGWGDTAEQALVAYVGAANGAAKSAG